jgi:hypothetical protein
MKKNKVTIFLFIVLSLSIIRFTLIDFAFAQSGEDPLSGTSVEEVMKNNASSAAPATASPAASSTATGNGTSTSGSYQNQEKIPGFDQTSDFPTYMKQIVNFFFATIGILAMFMLMIGAYQYLMTAGNIAKEDSAKTTISSALSGLILGLIAYLLLQTINPDLVAFKLDALSISTSGLSNYANNTSNNSSATKSSGLGKGCEALNPYLQNNTSGVDACVLKTIASGGESCDKSLSTDGFGSCGYFQVLPANRCSICGICGSDSCSRVQNDPQLDVNCGAAYIKTQIYDSNRCAKTDLSCIGKCYNDSCKKCGTNNYCDRVQSYYDNNCKSS